MRRRGKFSWIRIVIIAILINNPVLDYWYFGLLRARFLLISLAMMIVIVVWTKTIPTRVLIQRDYSGNNYSDSLLNFQEIDDKSTVIATETAAKARSMNSQQGFSRLPPHYLRQNSNSSSFAMDNSSFGLVGSMGLDHHTQARIVNSNLLRQSSSPAGLFSHISIQNAIVFYLFSSFLSFNVIGFWFYA